VRENRQLYGEWLTLKRNRYIEEQIIGYLAQAETGMSIKEFCRPGYDSYFDTFR